MRWLVYLLGASLLLVAAVPVVVALMPTGWIVERAERYAQESLGLELDIGGLDLEVFSGAPGAQVSAVSLGDGQGGQIVSGAEAEVRVDLGSLLGGELVFERVALADAEIDLDVDEQGRGNWEALLPEPAERTTGQPAERTAPGIPAIRSIEIEDVRLAYDDAMRERSAELTLSASGSTTDPERPTRLDAEGSVDGVPVSLDAELSALGELGGSMDDLAVDVELVAGDTRAGVAGTIGDPRTLRELDIAFELSAPDVRDIEALAGVPLPVLPPYRLAGDLLRDGEDFVLRRFDGELGDSDIEGDVRANLATEPPTLFANVISRTLDLDDLAGLLGGVPDPDETVTPEQERAALADEQDGRLLPDASLDLRPLVKAFNGAVSYEAREVLSPVYPVESIDARLEIDGDDLTVSPLTFGIGGGEASATIALDVRPVPAEGTVDLEIRSVDLGRVMETLGIDDDSVGQIGGRAKYWIRGDSIASFAADLDGGILLLMTGGGLDALLVELASIDLLESALLAIDPGKTLTEIDCAYLDLQSRDGLNEIETFVVDTADTVFVADGSIDLAEESFDIAVEPHPKDPSLIEVASGVRVTGTIDDFSVVPGAELVTRTAAAAVLATVAAPAAALLAFVGTGANEGTPYCDGLVGELDDAR